MNGLNLDAKILGERIRNAREKSGYSQEDFAYRVERDQRAISEIENGKRKLSVTELPRFAKVLDKPILYFFEGEHHPQDYDYSIMSQIEKLPSDEAKQSAIDLLRVFTQFCEDQ